MNVLLIVMLIGMRCFTEQAALFNRNNRSSSFATVSDASEDKTITDPDHSVEILNSDDVSSLTNDQGDESIDNDMETLGLSNAEDAENLRDDDPGLSGKIIMKPSNALAENDEDDHFEESTGKPEDSTSTIVETESDGTSFIPMTLESTQPTQWNRTANNVESSSSKSDGSEHNEIDSNESKSNETKSDESEGSDENEIPSDNTTNLDDELTISTTNDVTIATGKSQMNAEFSVSNNAKKTSLSISSTEIETSAANIANMPASIEDHILDNRTKVDTIGLYVKNSNTREEGTEESGAHVSDIKKSDAQMSDTNESGAHVSDTNDSGAHLPETKESGAHVLDTKESGAHVLDTKESDAQVSDTNVSGAQVSDNKKSDAQVSDTNVSGSQVSDTKKSDAQVSDTNVSGSQVSDTKVSGAQVSDTNVSGTHVSDTKKSDAHVSDTNVSGAQVSDTKVPGAQVSDTNVSGTHVSDIKKSDAQVSDTNVSGAQVSDTKKSDAQVSDTNVSGAHVSDINESDAHLSDTTKVSVVTTSKSVEGNDTLNNEIVVITAVTTTTRRDDQIINQWQNVGDQSITKSDRETTIDKETANMDSGSLEITNQKHSEGSSKVKYQDGNLKLREVEKPIADQDMQPGNDVSIITRGDRKRSNTDLNDSSLHIRDGVFYLGDKGEHGSLNIIDQSNDDDYLSAREDDIATEPRDIMVHDQPKTYSAPPRDNATGVSITQIANRDLLAINDISSPIFEVWPPMDAAEAVAEELEAIHSNRSSGSTEYKEYLTEPIDEQLGTAQVEERDPNNSLLSIKDGEILLKPSVMMNAGESFEEELEERDVNHLSSESSREHPTTGRSRGTGQDVLGQIGDINRDTDVDQTTQITQASSIAITEIATTRTTSTTTSSDRSTSVSASKVEAQSSTSQSSADNKYNDAGKVDSLITPVISQITIVATRPTDTESDLSSKSAHVETAVFTTVGNEPVVKTKQVIVNTVADGGKSQYFDATKTTKPSHMRSLAFKSRHARIMMLCLLTFCFAPLAS